MECFSDSGELCLARNPQKTTLTPLTGTLPELDRVVVLKKSPQESTLNTLLYYAQPSASQDSGKKSSPPTFYRNGPHCLISVFRGGVWGVKNPRKNPCRL